MAKTNKKLTRRRKKPAKAQWRFSRALVTLVMRTIKWLISFIIQATRKNPLAAIGFCLFLYFSLFLANHILFNQSVISRSFFFQQEKKNLPNTTGNKLTIDTILANATNADNSTNATENQSTSSISNKSITLPLTPKAKGENNVNAPYPQSKLFSQAFPQFKPFNNANSQNISTNIPSNEKTKIMRVQTGLRNFGHNNLIINGIIDAKTKKAILDFQKKFTLKQSGMIDQQLLTKMQEIGLL